MLLFPAQGKLGFFFAIFILCKCGYSEENVKRKLSLTVYPDCSKSKCDNSKNEDNVYNLIHVQADGPNDTVHYLWSNVGSFTILIALTQHHVNINVDWDKFLSLNNFGSINFTETPIYASTVSFTTLWDFIDTDDTASFIDVPMKSKIPYPFKYLKWDKVTVRENTDEVVKVDFNLLDNNLTGGFSRTFIELSAFGSDGRPDSPPRLLYNSNVTQVELLLDRLNTNSTKSRFALEMVLISSNVSQGNFTAVSTKTLDDEYTPGIFSVIDVANERKSDDDMAGYMQWKPICYTSPDRVIENSTDVKLNLPHQQINDSYCAEELNGSLAAAFFKCSSTDVMAQIATISYGAKEDKFYQHFNYSTWTFNIGYGSMPKDEISPTVILVILVGLGIPILLIIGGGTYIGVKRCKGKKDDLLLEQ